MPRVVPDQRSKFENEEFFRKLSRECEIKYTGFRDRPHEERQARFQNACRDGRSEIAFVATGTNLSLQFFPASWQGEQRQTPTREYVDFEREGGKVYLKAPMILNGVCVIWKGWIDLQRLDGMGCLEFDEERAQVAAVSLRYNCAYGWQPVFLTEYFLCYVETSTVLLVFLINLINVVSCKSQLFNLINLYFLCVCTAHWDRFEAAFGGMGQRPSIKDFLLIHFIVGHDSFSMKFITWK
uniref:Core-binding factor subunit beta n=1 Tax=Crocodylus porosus TaxID=8502 RepID=A0A7M4E2R2_CROPO